jgi:hypothetical protein
LYWKWRWKISFVLCIIKFMFSSLLYHLLNIHFLILTFWHFLQSIHSWSTCSFKVNFFTLFFFERWIRPTRILYFLFSIWCIFYHFIIFFSAFLFEEIHSNLSNILNFRCLFWSLTRLKYRNNFLPFKILTIWLWNFIELRILVQVFFALGIARLIA